VFLFRFWITKIFQPSILFETNKFHHGGPPCSVGPGAIAPVAPPLIRPWPRAPRSLNPSLLTGSNTKDNCEENPQQCYYIWNRVPKFILLNKLQISRGFLSLLLTVHRQHRITVVTGKFCLKQLVLVQKIILQRDPQIRGS